MYKPQLPPRPAIPLSLYVFLCILISQALVLRFAPLQIDVCKKLMLCFMLAVFLCTTLFILFLFLTKVRKKGYEQKSLFTVFLILLIALLCGAILSLGFLIQENNCKELLLDTTVSQWELRALSDSSKSRFGWSCKALAVCNGRPSGNVYLRTKEEILCGEIISAIGRFKANAHDEWGRSAQSQGVIGTVTASHILSQKEPSGILAFPYQLRKHALSCILQQKTSYRALLAASVCAYKTEMAKQSLDELFEHCGVSHLVAVSGSHIAIFIVILLKIARYIRVHVKKTVLAALVFAAVFVLMCGAPSSAVRSWAMCALSFGSIFFKRRDFSLSALSLVGVIMLAFDPSLSCQLSFLLSVFSVMGLCLFSPYVNYLLEMIFISNSYKGGMHFLQNPRFMNLASTLLSALSATLVAQLMTLPCSIAIFHSISLVAPLANIVVGLPFSWMIGLGMAAALSAPFPFLSQMILVLSDGIAAFTISSLKVLEKLPFAFLFVDISPFILTAIITAALLSLLVFWPAASKRCIVGFLCSAFLICSAFFIKWRFFAPAEVVVMDVGQGDAILVREGAHALLIDTGPKGVLPQALARQHIYHLDAVVLTHLHDDHIGGLSEIAGALDCGKVYVAQGVRSHMSESLQKDIQRLSNSDAGELSYKDSLSIGNFTLELVWPRSTVTGEENSDSIEFALSYKDERGRSLSAFLTGDAEQDESSAVLAAEDVSDVDFLKVGHHGSEVSLAKKDAMILSPEISVASAGKDNEYGHPSKACVDMLKSIGSEFFCTIESGDVSIEPGVLGPLVSLQKLP